MTHFKQNCCFHGEVSVSVRPTRPAAGAHKRAAGVSRTHPECCAQVRGSAQAASRYYGSSPLGDALLTSLSYPPLNSAHQTLSSAGSHTLRAPHFVFSFDSSRRGRRAITSSNRRGRGQPLCSATGPHGEGSDSSCN